MDQLFRTSDLKTSGKRLSENPNVYMVVNENDFLLAPEDLRWLKENVPHRHAAFFRSGGHLGNLFLPSVQNAIRSALLDSFFVRGDVLPPEANVKN